MCTIHYTYILGKICRLYTIINIKYIPGINIHFAKFKLKINCIITILSLTRYNKTPLSIIYMYNNNKINILHEICIEKCYIFIYNINIINQLTVNISLKILNVFIMYDIM